MATTEIDEETSSYSNWQKEESKSINLDDLSIDECFIMKNNQFDVVSQSIPDSELQWVCKLKGAKSVSEFSSKHSSLNFKSVGDYKPAITAVLTEDKAIRFLSETNTVNVSKSSHNEYFEENIDLAEYIKENFKDLRFVISHDENMQRFVPKLTVYKKTYRGGKVKNKLVLVVDYYLKVYCNNFEYDIVRRFFAPEKETYNNLELFNLGFTSEENFEQLCKLMQKTFESNPKRFRNIILYGGVRKSKGKIKCMNNDFMKKLLLIISKFETGSIFLIDFELCLDIFVQTIQMMKCDITLMFINCLIVSQNIIESYAKINHKSSRFIKVCNCNFESNYFNESIISNKRDTELSYVIKYIILNKYWEKHLNKIFLFNSFEHDFFILSLYKQKKNQKKSLSILRCYCYKIKQFLKILKRFQYLEENKIEVKSIKIFNNNKLFEISGFEDQEQYSLKYTVTNSSDPNFEIKTRNCKAKDLNMDNVDIFEFSDGQKPNQFILFIRGDNLALSVHLKDENVKFYNTNMREDLLGIDSETLVFETIILGNNDPLNVSKLNTTSKNKSEDYSNYSYNSIMCYFALSAILCPKFKKIVIDGYSNLNNEVLQEICDIIIRDKKIIIDATKMKDYKGQNEWKIAIQ